jgi:hypothetical protein
MAVGKYYEFVAPPIPEVKGSNAGYLMRSFDETLEVPSWKSCDSVLLPADRR